MPHIHKHNPKEHSHKPKEHSNKRGNNKRTILFQSVGGMSNASTRYICYENARYLRNYGWKIKIGKANTGNFDIVIFQKRYNGRDLERARATRGKTVLQISEARFVNNHEQSDMVVRFAKEMDGVIVGSRYLQKWFAKREIASTVIPTGLDFASLPQGTVKSRPIKICWIGSAVNERYLAHLVAPLNRLWQDYDFEFRVIGAGMYNANWAKQPNFIRWQLGEAEKRVAECHIGVAPLDQSSIEMTKPPSKLILYMSLRLAIIATSTPPYRSLIANGINGFLIDDNSPDKWYNALVELFDTERRNWMAIQGYNSCQSYDAPVIARRWDRFLRRL